MYSGHHHVSHFLQSSDTRFTRTLEPGRCFYFIRENRKRRESEGQTQKSRETEWEVVVFGGNLLSRFGITHSGAMERENEFSLWLSVGIKWHERLERRLWHKMGCCIVTRSVRLPSVNIIRYFRFRRVGKLSERPAKTGHFHCVLCGLWVGAFLIVHFQKVHI